MRIAIDYGHNIPGIDTGATNKDKTQLEDKYTIEIAYKLYYLICENTSDEVCIVTPNVANSLHHSLQQRCLNANNFKADLFISIHLNAFNSQANGVEVWGYDNNTKELATQICSNLSELGYKNRGFKISQELYVLRETLMTAILIECGFVDSDIDMALYDADKIAYSIFKALNLTSNKVCLCDRCLVEECERKK